MLWLNVFFSAREPYGPFMPQILQFIMALVVIIAWRCWSAIIARKSACAISSSCW